MHRYLGGSLMSDWTSSLCRENVAMARGSPVKEDIMGFFKLEVTLESERNFP